MLSCLLTRALNAFAPQRCLCKGLKLQHRHTQCWENEDVLRGRVQGWFLWPCCPIKPWTRPLTASWSDPLLPTREQAQDQGDAIQQLQSILFSSVFPELQWIYNVVSISALQWSDSVIRVYLSIFIYLWHITGCWVCPCASQLASASPKLSVLLFPTSSPPWQPQVVCSLYLSLFLRHVHWCWGFFSCFHILFIYFWLHQLLVIARGLLSSCGLVALPHVEC